MKVLPAFSAIAFAAGKIYLDLQYGNNNRLHYTILATYCTARYIAGMYSDKPVFLFASNLIRSSLSIAVWLHYQMLNNAMNKMEFNIYGFQLDGEVLYKTFSLGILSAYTLTALDNVTNIFLDLCNKESKELLVIDLRSMMLLKSGLSSSVGQFAKVFAESANGHYLNMIVTPFLVFFGTLLNDEYNVPLAVLCTMGLIATGAIKTASNVTLTSWTVGGAMNAIANKHDATPLYQQLLCGIVDNVISRSLSGVYHLHFENSSIIFKHGYYMANAMFRSIVCKAIDWKLEAA